MSVAITIQETVNEVDITVNQNVITVNVTRTTGSGGVDSVNGETGVVTLTTDNVSEGSINLYFTVARVRSTILTGISFVSGSVITATDTVLSALGKLQKQISSIDLPYVLKIGDRVYQEPIPQSGTTYTFEIDDRFKDLSLQGGGNEYLLNDDADLFPINSVIMFHVYDTPSLLNYTSSTDVRYLGTYASADIPIEVGDDCRLKKIGSGSIWELVISNKSTGGGGTLYTPPYVELIFTAVQTAPQTGITSGTLIEGGRYTIFDTGTADFTISGAPNNDVGTVFVANSTPPDWGDFGTLDFEGNPIVTILNNPLGDTYTSSYVDVGSYILEGLLDFPLNTFPKYGDGYVDVVQKSAEDFTGVGQSAYLWYKNPSNDKQIIFRSGVSGNLTDDVLDGSQLFIVKIFNS